MRVGLIGLGKLGLPVAYAMAGRGLDVYGYDPAVSGPPDDTDHEQYLGPVVDRAAHRMNFTDLVSVVLRCEVVFVAVQTPHEPRFEGITPLPADRADFDYTYLRDAIREIRAVAERTDRRLTVAVISTVLPGTMQREIAPLLGANLSLVYNPSFIAMGTTIQDFADPEFVLLGESEPGAGDPVALLLSRCVQRDAPVVRTSIENAELIKVAYNTFIGLKIAFANTLMEVCHKTGCDVDTVTDSLKLAQRRLISNAYLSGGMGDGGACHPRDGIALSWLARELDLSYDLFGATMECREAQARWLADLMCQYELPKGIIGTAYKPESAIQTGSAALLVRSILERWGLSVWTTDPRVSPDDPAPLSQSPHVWLIGCKHSGLPSLEFPEGSVVIDPFRYMPEQPGVEVIRIGEGLSPAADDRPAADGRAVRAAAA